MRPAAQHNQRVFISYRRSDSQAQANGIHDGLSHRLSSVKLFMDIDSIPAGVDFEDHIRSEIEVCDVVLVLIGDNWLDPDPETGRSRLDEPEDFVRLEIESALASPRVRLLPVLVEGAQMPRSFELPESLRPLTRINAIEMSDRRWTADLERLASRLQEMAEEQSARAKGRAEDAQAPPQFTPAVYQSSQPASSPSPTTPHVPFMPQRVQPLWDAHRVIWVMMALSCCTMGLGSFVVPLWAASRHPHERSYRVRMWQLAAVLAAVSVTGFVLVGTAPVDETDTPDSVASNIGVVLVLISGLVGALIAGLELRGRAPSGELPGTATELERRRAREQYRELIESDISLARSINVGRPDLKRDYTDGGLLDLNSIPADAMVQFGGIPQDVVQRIVTARDELGRFSSLEEVAVYAQLPESVLVRLQERAVFL